MKQRLEMDCLAVSHLLEPDVFNGTSPVLRRERNRKVPYLSGEHQVDFVQLVKLKNVKGDRKIKGKINYMVCDKSQCITSEEEFKVELK